MKRERGRDGGAWKRRGRSRVFIAKKRRRGESLGKGILGKA